MHRFNISAKLMSAFAVLLAVMAAISVVGVNRIGEVNAIATEMRERWLPASQSLGDLHSYLSQYRIKQAEVVYTPGPRSAKLARNAQVVIDKTIADYRADIATPQQKALLDQFEKGWRDFTADTDRLITVAQSDPAAAHAALNAETLDHYYALEDLVLQLIDLNAKGAGAISEQSATIYTSAQRFMVGAAVAALVVAVFMLVVLMATVARPVKRMSAAEDRLAAGDITIDVPGLARADELGQLARALDGFKALFARDAQRAREEQARADEANVTIGAIGGGLAALAQGDLTHRVAENGHGAMGKLHMDYNAALGEMSQVLGRIVAGCRTIKLGIDEIAAASSDLSARSEQQANALAQTARTLNAFTGTVKITADNARQTSGRLRVARDTAGQVEIIAHDAVGAMRSIEDSSRQMAEIIAVHRVPDQPARAQRRGRGGPRRGRRQGLCRGGIGSARAGPAECRRGQGYQDPDHDEFAADRRWRCPGRRQRRSAAPDRGRSERGLEPGRGNCRSSRKAGRWHRRNLAHGVRHGFVHPAQCRDGGGKHRQHAHAVERNRQPDGTARPLPPGRWRCRAGDRPARGAGAAGRARAACRRNRQPATTPGAGPRSCRQPCRG